MNVPPIDLNISTLHINEVSVSSVNINSNEFQRIQTQVDNFALFINVVMILQTIVLFLIIWFLYEIRKQMKYRHISNLLAS